MSSSPTIELFKGTNWEECDDFIGAIREAAWKEGKIRDPGWMADFASLHFSRNARSWHSRLPRDVRQDWGKLEAALLDRWAPPDEDDEPPIEPTPAAARSLNHSDRTDRPLQGVLKILIDGSNKNSYLKLHEDGYGEVTKNTNEALRFRCNSLSNATLMEQIDGSCHSWLAVQWSGLDPDLKNGSTTFGYLVLVDSLTLKTSLGTGNPYQLISCTVSADSEVTPFWKNDHTSKITIGIFADRDALFTAADPEAYGKSNRGEKRVKLFIEPIDECS